jgi:hypothetical protein
MRPDVPHLASASSPALVRDNGWISHTCMPTERMAIAAASPVLEADDDAAREDGEGQTGA